MHKFLAILSFLALFFAVATGRAGAQEAESVRLGVCLSLTGDYWQHGRIELAGANIRVRELNESGGIDGRMIELVVRDSGSSPERAAQAVEELARDGVSVIIGPALSELIPAVREAALRHNAVIISPAATTPGLGKRGDRVFSILLGDDYQGDALAAFILQKLPIRSAAIIKNAASPYSRSIAAAFADAFGKNGGAIVAEEDYDVPVAQAYDYDFEEILKRVEIAAPGIILLPDYHDDVAAIISQATRLDMHTPFCGGDSWNHESVFIASGRSITGAYYVGLYDPDAMNPQMERFLRLLDDSHDPEATPSSVTGYDAVTLAVEAIRDGTDPERVIAALYALRDFPLATGNITIDPDRGTLKTAYICQIIDKGGDTFVGKAIARIPPGGNGDGVAVLDVKD